MNILRHIATRVQGMYSRSTRDDPNISSQTMKPRASMAFKQSCCMGCFQNTLQDWAVLPPLAQRSRGGKNLESSDQLLPVIIVLLRSTQLVQLTFCLGYLFYIMSSLLVSQEQRPGYLIFPTLNLKCSQEINSHTNKNSNIFSKHS